MRCAVSPRLDLSPESGHATWLETLREGQIEFVVVPDPGNRAAKLMEFRNIEGVLLADPSAVPGPGTRRGRDLSFHRTEREMVRFARARRIPIVGIGHWAEFLGLYFGGRLRPSPETSPENRSLTLSVAPGWGPPRATVHPAGRMHCDPKDFPEVLEPIAWDEHGNIAGFVHRDEPILGIHWQPGPEGPEASDPVTRFLKGASRQPADAPEHKLRTG